MKRVYGSYTTEVQAAAAVEELYKQGYTKRQIKVVSNKDLGSAFSGVDTVDADNRADDRSAWQKIKDAFTFDEYDDNYLNSDLDSTESNLLNEYKTNLDKGEIIILVQGDVGGTGHFVGNRNVGAVDYDLDRDVTTDRNVVSDDERVIELKKEELDIDKDRVEVGEVDIKKVVKTETKTIEVPVEKEEIVIERRPGTGSVTPGDTIDEAGIFEKDNEIHIPISEERVDVTKRTVSGDDVVIKKEKHTENKTIVETVKSEDIEVEGDARVETDTTIDNDLKK